MKNSIDLSKINVKETPKKIIKANFDGTEKDFEIRALNDGERVNFFSLLGSGKDVHRTRNMYVYLLTCGLNIEDSVAAILFDNVNAETIRVGDEVFKLSNLFEEAKAQEAENAEKNSAAETQSARE